MLNTVLNCSFFFFQAEDGIRDIGVTGVQTCALPICARARRHGGEPLRPRRTVHGAAPRRRARAPRGGQRARRDGRGGPHRPGGGDGGGTGGGRVGKGGEILVGGASFKKKSTSLLLRL